MYASSAPYAALAPASVLALQQQTTQLNNRLLSRLRAPATTATTGGSAAPPSVRHLSAADGASTASLSTQSSMTGAAAELARTGETDTLADIDALLAEVWGRGGGRGDVVRDDGGAVALRCWGCAPRQ